jgi:hypothetical protein
MLTEVREYKLGCVFARQYLDQCVPSLRASLAASSSIKMALGVSMSDARAFASDLRTTPDFSLSQLKLQFGTHFGNVTLQAVSIPVMADEPEGWPSASREAYGQLIELNPHPSELPTPDPSETRYHERRRLHDYRDGQSG